MKRGAKVATNYNYLIYQIKKAFLLCPILADKWANVNEMLNLKEQNRYTLWRKNCFSFCSLNPW
jgi:hypothetical protein